MTKFQVEIHDDILTVINKIKSIDDAGIELEIPEGAILFDNVHNLKLLEKEANRINKTLHYVTNDEYGQILLNSINESESSEFMTKEVTIGEESPPSEEEIIVKKKEAKRRLPSFVSVTSKGKSRNIKILKVFIFLFFLLGGVGFAGYKALWAVPKANVKVAVNAQPLIKSVQIKVVKDAESSVERKELKGYGAATIAKNEGVIETTGEKIVGEKADGKIRIYNKTTDEKKFKKGHIVVYDKDNLEFELLDDVTVPERTEDLSGTTPIITPGEATVNVRAMDIGDKYNLEKDKTFDVEGEDSDDFSAKNSENFDGGKSEIVKTVTEADKTNLSSQMFEDNSQTVLETLSNRVGAGKIYIQGSGKVTIANETYNQEIDAEADELKLEQELSAEGLAYSDRELKGLLEGMLEEFVPEGYELSSKDTELKVEILGNAETTVLSPTESDLQVTIKAFVITQINEDEIKQQLLGKTITDAQKYLGGIRNIETYELAVTPNIPFWQKMPRNIDNIVVEIVKE